MFPVLLTLGPLTVSSFGLFLALAFLASVFVSWRVAKVYDISEEKIFDLAIITFLGGIIGARIYFVAFNWSFFSDLEKVVLINRYPGLSFWGGLVGGAFVLWFFAKKFKLDFWQIVDFAAVGFLAGLILGDIGCFLGGCSYGAVSTLPIATPVVGLIGKRLPVALFEAVLIGVTFAYLWGQVIKFHFAGKVVALSLIFLGVIKFITEFFRGDSYMIVPSLGISFGTIWSILVVALGIFIFYRQSKRSIWVDLKNLPGLFSSPKRRKILLSSFGKCWYNFKTAWKVKIVKTGSFYRSWPKKLKRRLNVKSTPTNFR